VSRSIALLRDVVGHHEGVATARTQAVGFEPSRPLTARSVLATALLGAPNGRLPVSHLVQAGRLLGIADGAVRTSLSRMVAQGELSTSDGVYELSGKLADRRHDIDGAVRPRPPGINWDGTWEIAVVRAGSRSAAQRHELRAAATRLRLGALRDGCWARPTNLDRERHPGARSVIARQCLTFQGAIADVIPADVEQTFGLSEWAGKALRLNEAIEAQPAEVLSQPTSAQMRDRFLLLIAAARHLRTDPMLPDELLTDDWPGERLRAAYDRLTQTLRRYLEDAVTSGGAASS
jgi:phenylacetic acid degradation operon negative regulatory protein